MSCRALVTKYMNIEREDEAEQEEKSEMIRGGLWASCSFMQNSSPNSCAIVVEDH
jgi:hypothetical protein